ncbi:MAG: hypothetical protein GX425_11030 [Peptococcaceae bacterium]|nr:hypothetical protein [Peptococcaceae bacterium]
MKKSCGGVFFSWPEAFQAGVEAVGGKGWNLGRLDRYGFSVPAGGVLGARAYQRFIEENGLLEEINSITETEEALALLREKIKAGHILRL